MALGEFIDDLDIGGIVMSSLGLEAQTESSTSEELGENRLESGSLF